jgi:hypothetical protein
MLLSPIRLHTKNVSKDDFAIPLFDFESPTFDERALEAAYERFQILHVKHVGTVSEKGDTSKANLCWRDIGALFARLSDKDKASWSVETMTAGDPPVSPMDFLAAETTPARAYCSFLVQHDTEAYNEAIARLPFQQFPATEWEYEPALWLFFGRNPLGYESLDGRPEHTDAITHDGTWHFQLSGKKFWFLRPTPDLLSSLRAEGFELSADKTFQVTCNEGDVIVVNTRLWFHHTVIPPQGRPSVSYARDFSIESNTGEAEPNESGMTNLDGLYATNEIASGTIVFTEAEMPDCSLHRSATDPNCEVVELEDGTSAVVSTRDIAAGEFFCTAESEDEDSESESSEKDQ